jgi:hypothetical protein
MEEGRGIEVPIEEAAHDKLPGLWVDDGELLVGALEQPAVVMDVAVAGAAERDPVLGRLHSRVLASAHALGPDVVLVEVTGVATYSTLALIAVSDHLVPFPACFETIPTHVDTIIPVSASFVNSSDCFRGDLARLS